MKTLKISIFLALILFNPAIESIAQGFWTQKADFGGDARYFGSGMAIGNKGYIGLGATSASPSNQDLWQYDPATNSWNQTSDFTNDRIYSACFSIGSIGYVCSGCYWDGTSGTQPFVFYQDMWAYDPATNSWTQKAGFPGAGRNGAFGFEIFGKGYVGMGLHRENSGANTYYNDLYEYDPLTDQWTQKASLPGSTRSYCINFSIGKHLYVGLGVSNVTQYILDIWQYDTQSDTWTQMNNFPGPARKYASCFVIGSKAYLFGGMDASQYFKDLWEYDPISDTWTQKEDLPSDPRYSAIGFSINGKGYIGTGYAPGAGGVTDELWEYTPSTSSIIKNDSENQIFVSPNPAKDFLKIEGVNWKSIRIFNEFGQIVINLKEYSFKNNIIDISNLKKGVYFIEVNENDEYYHQKFIKE